jgi:hypothetical protein
MIGGSGGGFTGAAGAAGERGISAGAVMVIGKGLKDSCSPYTVYQIFGAPLNPPAPPINCKPVISEPTNVFDLSTITLNHEVVLAMYTEDNVPGGYEVRFDWYRSRDSQLLFHYAYALPVGNWPWVCVYSYIGYVPWEIIENGAYTVVINAVGRLMTTKGFTVSGVSVPVAEAKNMQIAYARVV